jgi:hypothetical protein
VGGRRPVVLLVVVAAGVGDACGLHGD